MAIKVTQRSYRITRPASVITDDIKQTTRSLSGHVFTPHGVVLVKSVNDPKIPYTLIRFALSGREYSHVEKRFLSARYMTTLASRLIAEAAERGGKP